MFCLRELGLVSLLCVCTAVYTTQWIHSDQGSNFQSQLFVEMCQMLGITKTRTTLYNPKSDGMIECFNRTLINMIAILIEEDDKHRTWDKHLAYATSAYRSTPHETPGKTPTMMMLGW